jgi:hypothetical protein
MTNWWVKATWTEDEVEATEQWEVGADTAHEAIREVTMHLRYQPHHVEARRGAGDMPRGQMRRVPPQ